MMIPHHAQAVQMAELAATWGRSTAQPGGHNMPGMGTMPGMSEQDMNQLQAASGVDFDRQFAGMMIAHHNGAIQMARDETLPNPGEWQ